MLDRTIAPAFGKLDHFALREADINHLSNGIPVYAIEAGTQEVLQVQVVIPAGKVSGERKLVAAATATLMEEGTELRSGAAIAEAVEYFGAQLQADTDEDETTFSLYTVNKYLYDTLPILSEVCTRPAFPEEELNIYIRNQRQTAEVNEQKVGHLANRAFKGVLFGSEHPLGRSASPADYETLTREDLTAHFQHRLRGNISQIMVAGKLTSDTIGLLDRQFGEMEWLPNVHHAKPDEASSAMHQQVERQGAVQNALRVGRVLFNRNHPDFVGMQFLSTVLGGYFGSRLMANIREDKGFTYGVNANLFGMRHAGHLTISTEVGADVSEAALAEIFKEMALLRNEAVGRKELETVRNYLLGVMLKGLDGPFAMSAKWRGYLKYGVGTDAHDDTLRQIDAMTPERLLELANRYLREEDMSVVTAGVKTA
jgi:zinc protease